MPRRAVIFILAIVLLFSLAACNGESGETINEESSQSGGTEAAQTTEDITPAGETTTEAETAAETTAEPAAETTEAPAPADAALTLDGLKKAAQDAGYTLSDSISYLPFEDDPAPQPLGGFDLGVLEGESMHIAVSILEFASADDAKLYYDFRKPQEEYGTHVHQRDKFTILFVSDYYDMESGVLALFGSAPAAQDSPADGALADGGLADGALADGGQPKPKAEVEAALKNYSITLIMQADGQEAYTFNEARWDTGWMSSMGSQFLVVDSAGGKMYMLDSGSKEGMEAPLDDSYAYAGIGTMMAQYLFMHESYKDSGLVMGGGEEVGGRSATVYTCTLQDAEQKYWIDNEFGFTLKFVQTGANNITAEVTSFAAGGVTMDSAVNLGEYTLQQ